jgi:hypothetical protein
MKKAGVLQVPKALPCSCAGDAHGVQERELGHGKRWHNMCKPSDPGGSQRYRCTCCGTVRSAGGQP